MKADQKWILIAKVMMNMPESLSISASEKYVKLQYELRRITMYLLHVIDTQLANPSFSEEDIKSLQNKRLHFIERDVLEETKAVNYMTFDMFNKYTYLAVQSWI